jgi:hypothetical protein
MPKGVLPTMAMMMEDQRWSSEAVSRTIFRIAGQSAGSVPRPIE